MNVLDELYYESHPEDLESAYADYVHECEESGEEPLPFTEWVDEL